MASIGLGVHDEDLEQAIREYQEKNHIRYFSEAGRELLRLAIAMEKAKEEQKKNG